MKNFTPRFTALLAPHLHKKVQIYNLLTSTKSQQARSTNKVYLFISLKQFLGSFYPIWKIFGLAVFAFPCKDRGWLSCNFCLEVIVPVIYFSSLVVTRNSNCRTLSSVKQTLNLWTCLARSFVLRILKIFEPKTPGRPAISVHLLWM